jgi:hypothetical protein
MPTRDLIASLQQQVATERSKRVVAERRATLLEQAVVQLRSEILRLMAEQAVPPLDLQ